MSEMESASSLIIAEPVASLADGGVHYAGQKHNNVSNLGDEWHRPQPWPIFSTASRYFTCRRCSRMDGKRDLERLEAVDG